MDPYVTIAIILGYFALLIYVSYLTSRGADSKSFFIGNKQSPWFVVSFGMIGASISGVTFISVPGWVLTQNYHYMQMVFGYFLGYVAIVHVLLPLYYRLNLISIYTYLQTRFGNVSYKTGAVIFLVSRIVGSSLRLFIAANVLQLMIFDKISIPFLNIGHIPFVVTLFITLALIFILTYKGGIKTIIWTDCLQTLFLLLAVVLSMFFIARNLNLDFSGFVSAVSENKLSTVFNFSDWRSSSFFLKQFLSGAFITIVMTGLDQDLMQKNISCKNLRDAQKNMYWYSLLLVLVNLMFLTLGVLLVIFSQKNGIALPDAKHTDNLFPQLATGGYFPHYVGIIFVLGLIAATYSSADSAITSLTTSVTIDLFEAENLPEPKLRRLRHSVHVAIACIMGLVIYFFRTINNDAVIDLLFKAAGYTYGPLLGLFAFGLFTRFKIRDFFVPAIAVLSPIFAFLVKLLLEHSIANYKAGYELLVINGIITFLGLLAISRRKK